MSNIENKYTCQRCAGTGEEPEATPSYNVTGPSQEPDPLLSDFGKALEEHRESIPVAIMDHFDRLQKQIDFSRGGKFGPELGVQRKAPVQGYAEGIPWEMHLRAYEKYCVEYRPQEALIKGGCRGGFGTSELDKYIPGWRDELSTINRLEAEIEQLKAKSELGGRAQGFDDNTRIVCFLDWMNFQYLEGTSPADYTFNDMKKAYCDAGKNGFTAGHAQGVASKVVVKPLLWEGGAVEYRYIAFVNDEAMYEVGNSECGKAYLLINWKGLTRSVHDDLEAAKAAAFTHHKSQTLSQIVEGGAQ